MSVGKIFKILIIVVACVIVGALVLNVLLPNATQGMVDAVENTIFNATGIRLDLNGNGVNENQMGAGNNYGGDNTVQGSNNDERQSAGVNGFQN